MKAILVIDMPDICYKCPCYDHEDGICQATSNWRSDREDGCPLRPLPEKKNTSKLQSFGNSQIVWTDRSIYQNEGWNACLEELEK